MVLYHVISCDIRDDKLYPLYELKELYVDLFDQYLLKYTLREREFVMDIPVPFLSCRWSDCVFLSSIHPKKIVAAFEELDRTLWKPFSYMEIPIDTLDLASMVRYSGAGFNKKESGDFRRFSEDVIARDVDLTERTKDYYREELSAGREPLLWAFSPQYLYCGQIDVSECAVKSTV